MRFFITLVLLLVQHPVFAQDWEERRVFGPAEAEVTLKVISSTDTSIFTQVIENFLSVNPNLSIDYIVTGTAELDRIFRNEAKVAFVDRTEIRY